MIKKETLISMSLKGFMDKTASESPAPGGGSVSAYMGALGCSSWDDGCKSFRP